MKDKDRKRIAALEEATRKAAAQDAARKYPDHLMTKDGVLQFMDALGAAVKRNVQDPARLLAILRDFGDEVEKHGLGPNPYKGAAGPTE